MPQHCRDLRYDAVPSLSNEARQKLAHFRPETLAQAARIAGVSQSDLAALLVHLKAGGRREAAG